VFWVFSESHLAQLHDRTFLIIEHSNLQLAQHTIMPLLIQRALVEIYTNKFLLFK